MKIEEMFPITGKKVERVWLYPREMSLLNGKDEISVLARIHADFILVVRADGELHGLEFSAHDFMVKSGRDPLYEKRMSCKAASRERCLKVIAWLSIGQEDGFTPEERTEWEALWEKQEAERQERERRLILDEIARRRREYERLKEEFG